MTNKPSGTLYVGVTSDLSQRVSQHRNQCVKGFTSRYQLVRLVFYEFHKSMYEAIKREKCIKEWKRSWKVRLIESVNSDWDDLFLED